MARDIRNWFPHPLGGSCPPHRLKTTLSVLNKLATEIKKGDTFFHKKTYPPFLI